MLSAPTFEHTSTSSTPYLRSRYRASIPRKNKAASLASERENRFPVVLHVDDGPTRCRGGVERLIEFSDRRGPVVGPFALCVGVVNDQAEAGAGPCRGVLKHLHVAVGVSESRD